MISIRVEGPKVEKIFFDGFARDKESFFEVIVDAYERQQFLNSLDKSCKQAIMQHNGEIEESTLQDLINEL